MIAHTKGLFKVFDASIYTIGNDFTTAEIDVWIDPASISTNEAKRDAHLRSADFFDVENHKQITFTSSTMGQPDEDGLQELWGELTMKGITKNVKLFVEFGGIIHDPWGNEKAGFTITGKINKTDWDLNWNTMLDAGNIMISEDVNIFCEVELIKTPQGKLPLELESLTVDKTTL